jgi:hypothetical protein
MDIFFGARVLVGPSVARRVPSFRYEAVALIHSVVTQTVTSR